MFALGLAGAVNETSEPAPPSPRSTPTISYFTTASQPAGTGAPVMRRTVWPLSSSRPYTPPAPMVATTFRVTGACSLAEAMSSRRTA